MPFPGTHFARRAAGNVASRAAWCARRSHCSHTQGDLDMPEGLNVEVAHKLTEKEENAERRKHRWEEVVEVIEVLVLSLAAIATAWSGFQASQWDDRQGLSYGQATTQRFAASAVSTLGGQQLAADSAMFTSWLGARAAGDTDLEMILVRRFTPDYRQAFDE